MWPVCAPAETAYLQAPDTHFNMPLGEMGPACAPGLSDQRPVVAGPFKLCYEDATVHLASCPASRCPPYHVCCRPECPIQYLSSPRRTFQLCPPCREATKDQDLQQLLASQWISQTYQLVSTVHLPGVHRIKGTKRAFHWCAECKQHMLQQDQESDSTDPDMPVLFPAPAAGEDMPEILAAPATQTRQSSQRPAPAAGEDIPQAK